MASVRAAKRRRISPTNIEEFSASISDGPSIQDFYTYAAQWDLEQDYEQRPRKANKKDKREKTRLPIKTADGILQHVEELQTTVEESDSFLDTDEEEEIANRATEEGIQKEISTVPLKAQIIQAKEEFARLATLINEDPEEHVGSFKKLANMVDQESHPVIQKLALATQFAIFRDVIPGYRIRPLGDEESVAKLSKDVRKLHQYEQSLLSAYQHYVQQLSSWAKPGNQQPNKKSVDLRTGAINCACSLLLSLPHFNFRSELLKILVNRLSKKSVDADFVKCRDTLEEVFEKDDDGIVSLEAVSLLSRMMRAREFRVDETVLDTFLHLRLLSEFSAKGSRDKIDHEPDERTFKGKKVKVKREFWSKKRRKLEKDRKAVEKDMKQADALVSHEERDKNQAETLKLVFGVYFRILKQRNEHLMGAELEGLAKYAHLINQDFFGDLLEALKELITKLEGPESFEQDNEEPVITRNSAREILLCTITAFALLEGQDASKAAASLHLDLSFFVTHLFRALYSLSTNPDIEFNPSKSLRLPDPYQTAALPSKKKKVNLQTPTVLLLRCLQSALVCRNQGTPPPLRLAGFTKRLMTMALQLPEKSSLAILSLVARVSKQHGRKIAPLWHTEERKGDGVFNPFAADVEASNTFAGTIWEGEILKLHYCPQVRDAATEVEKIIAAVK
jgi:nucleolar complex protein 3